MILDFDLGYKIKANDLDEDRKQITPIKMTNTLIFTAINEKFTKRNEQTGNMIVNMTRKDGRVWGRISDKLDDAEIDGKTKIELSDGEFDWFFKEITSDDLKIHPNMQRHFNILCDYLDEMKIEKNKQEKPTK